MASQDEAARPVLSEGPPSDASDGLTASSAATAAGSPPGGASNLGTDNQAGRFNIQAIVAIALVLTLQSYWLVGTTNLKDIDKYETELNDLAVQISNIRSVVSKAGENADREPLLAPLQQRQEAAFPRLESAQIAIETWNRVWGWAVFWSSDRSPCIEGSSGSDDSAAIDVATGQGKQRLEQRNASAATSILGLYVLPLLYGWLGATLRGLRRIVELDPVPVVILRQTRMRIGMGAVAGPIIGLFLSPDVLSSLPAQTAPFALAFIAGYATDAFFSILDRLSDSLKEPPSKS